MTNLVSNELQLVESQDVREKYIDRVEVLNKVKELVLLANDMHVTTEMVSNYYEVDIEAVKWHIKNNHDELLSDGMKVLDGKELREFKHLCQIQSRAKSLTIIPRRAILRLGMLLQSSIVAQKIRTYLLNVENKTPIDKKVEALVETLYADNLIQSQNIVLMLDKLESTMDRLSQLESNDKKLTEENKILRLETYDMKIEIRNMIDVVKEVNEKFQLPNNPSGEFEIYKVKFNIHQGHFYKKYMELYEALEVIKATLSATL